MSSEERKLKIKEMIVNRLNLGIDPSIIKDGADLFGSIDDVDSIGLDSVDALELAVGLMNEFGVEVSDENMHVFKSVDSINEFIESLTNVER